jgi:uncharacterized membrane protein
MDPQLYPWLRIVHVVGIVLWVGGLIAVLSLLRAHGLVAAAGRDALLTVEKKTAILLDVGATLSIGIGLYLAFKSPKFATNAFASGGWFHIKLTLVVLGILLPHIEARRTMRRFRQGKVAQLPGWLLPTVILAAIGILIFAVHPTLLRK